MDMKIFGLQLLTMTLGALLIMFLKAVWAARDLGDTFSLRTFVIENSHRVLLVFVGVAIVGSLLFLDAGSVQTIIGWAGIEVQIGTGAVAGAAIAGLVMVVPKK